MFSSSWKIPFQGSGSNISIWSNSSISGSCSQTPGHLPQFKHWLVASSKGSPVFSALRRGDRKPCQLRIQAVFVCNSQIGQIGHLSLYFYKLHAQYENTIDGNIQTAFTSFTTHRPSSTPKNSVSRSQIKTQTTLGCYDVMRCSSKSLPTSLTAKACSMISRRRWAAWRKRNLSGWISFWSYFRCLSVLVKKVHVPYPHSTYLHWHQKKDQ